MKISWLGSQIAAGAGDISLLRLEDSSGLIGNGAGVEIFEMVKGTLLLTYRLPSLDLGKEYFARVAAHNAIGISPFSYISSGAPTSQPGVPVDLSLSIASGTSLRANWFPPQDNGGSEVTSYLVEWWKENEPGVSETQMITTAADRGEFEVQSISLRSDANNLGGTHTLSFPGEEEKTSSIAFGSPPIGLGSVKEALEGLSNVGEVDVSQDFSFCIVPSLLLDVRDGVNVATVASSSALNPLQAGLSYNDLIVLGTGFRARVKDVTTGSISLGTEADADTDLNFSGGDTDSVHVERWSFGFQYTVTFTSFNGNVPLLLAEPSNGWTGTNPSISVNEVHQGLFATGGVFRASFLGESTPELHHDASAEVVREALVGLKGLSDVSAEIMVNGNGYTWLVTFVSNRGDQEALKVSGTGLTGTNGRVTVTTGNNGELPGGYGSAVALSSSSGADPTYTITGLEQGVTYNVTVRAGNGEGYGISVSAPAHAPLEAPGLSNDAKLIAMSDSMLKVVWGPPESMGGAPVSRYRLEWDLDADFSNIATSGFYHEFVVDDSTLPESGKYYYNIIIAPSSSWRPRFARVRASNGFSWGEWAYTEPASVTPAQGVPGKVRNPSLKVLSGVEIMVSWEMPSSELAEYGGDGGSPIVDYIVEWDTSPSFNSPPHRATIPMPGALEYVIGGRNMFTGEEEDELEGGVEYYVHVTATNAIGYGTWVPANPASVTTMDQTPKMPRITGASPVDPTTSRVEWEPPLRDGGSVLESFRVEWDIDSAGFSHVNGSGKAGGWEDVPLAKEVSVTAVTADSVQEEQWIVATVEVTNEVQRVSTDASGVDEVQLIATTAKAVQPAIQTITTYAADYNERQTISLDALEVNEIQWIETTSDEIVESQSLYVAARRVSEVSEFTLVLTGDTTDVSGDSLVAIAATESIFQLTLDTSAMRWAAIQSQEVTSAVVSFNDASGVQNALDGLTNVDLINVDYDRQVTTVDAASGVVELTYMVTFAGDGLRGDVPDGAFFVSSCADIGSGDLSLSCPSTMTTITEGNEVTGSFHVEYNCEANVEDLGTVQHLSSGIDSSVITLDNSLSTSLIEPGDTIRVYFGTVLMPWSYWKVIDISSPSGDITLSSPFTGLDDTPYVAQAGDFYSDPEAANGFGVSSACMASDPETSVTGIDCASSAPTLTDTIMGLETVAVSTFADDDCVQVERTELSPGNSIELEGVTDEYVGYVYTITFLCANGDLPDLGCITDGPIPLVTSNLGMLPVCAVKPEDGTDGSILSGELTVTIGYPHPSEGAVSQAGLTAPVSWRATATEVKEAMETVMQASSPVWGDVAVTRTAAYGIGHTKWSGQWKWTVTYLSRPGSVSDMTGDASLLIGNNPGIQTGTDVDGNEVGGSSGLTYCADGGAGSCQQSSDSAFAVSLTAEEFSRTFNRIFFNVGHASGALYSNGLSDVAVPVSSFSAAGVPEVGDWIDLDDIYIVNSVDIVGSNAVLGLDRLISGGSATDFYHGYSAITASRTGPTAAMGYTWEIESSHRIVGGNQATVISEGNAMTGAGVTLVSESVSGVGNEILGTFTLSYGGMQTVGMLYDASTADVESVLNGLETIYPSKVKVSRTGPHVDDDQQVKGYTWTVTFDSSTWHNTSDHDNANPHVDGNWQGAPVGWDATWPSTGKVETSGVFSKVWGKNVGNLLEIGCQSDGLRTTRNDGSEKCQVVTIQKGSDPLGGSFSLTIDATSLAAGITCDTAPISHNAWANTGESGGDGTSVEEILQDTACVGDVYVTRTDDIVKLSGGYEWLITFLRDSDSPCEQKDDITGLCNSPGDVPKLSVSSSAALLGTDATVTVLEAVDGLTTPPFSASRQIVRVWDGAYSASDGFTTDPEFELSIDGYGSTACLLWDVSANDLANAINVIAPDLGGVSVTRSSSPGTDLWGLPTTPAPNGYSWEVTFSGYEGGAPLLTMDTTTCTTPFTNKQNANVMRFTDYVANPTSCDSAGCADGVILRGIFNRFDIGDGSGCVSSSMPWNADTDTVKAFIESCEGGLRKVDVTRTVLDPYGSVQWDVTFTQNPGETPLGAGNVDALTVIQEGQTGPNPPQVTEIKAGSTSLGGTFSVDYLDPVMGSRAVSFDETARRLEAKLNEMSTISNVIVIRENYPGD